MGGIGRAPEYPAGDPGWPWRSLREIFLFKNRHFRKKYFSSHQYFMNIQMWNEGAGGHGRPQTVVRVSLDNSSAFYEKVFSSLKINFHAKYLSSEQYFINFQLWTGGAGGLGRAPDCPRMIPRWYLGFHENIFFFLWKSIFPREIFLIIWIYNGTKLEIQIRIAMKFVPVELILHQLWRKIKMFKIYTHGLKSKWKTLEKLCLGLKSSINKIIQIWIFIIL